MVEYPQCVPHKGCGKVKCLIEAIKRDDIPWKLKIKRLMALIYYNRVWKWCPQGRVKRWVRAAVANIAIRHGKAIRDPCRLANILMKAYKQTGDKKYKRLAEKYAEKCRRGG